MNNPKDEQVKEPTIDELLEDMNRGDITEAKRVILKSRITELQLRDAENQAKIRDLQNGSVRPAAAPADNESPEDKAKKQISENAVLLIQKGVAPEAVARYIMASSSGNANALPGANGSMDLEGFAKLVTTITALVAPKNGGTIDPALKETLDAVKSAVETLKEEKANKQVEAINTLAEEVKAMRKEQSTKTASPAAGAVMKPRILREKAEGGYERIPLDDDDVLILPRNDTKAQTIEEEKLKLERDRLDMEKQNKAAMQKIVADVGGSLIETGTTIAAHFVEGASAPAARPKENAAPVKTMQCECGFAIPISPPPNDWHLQCPKCGSEYTDWDKAPPEIKARKAAEDKAEAEKLAAEKKTEAPKDNAPAASPPGTIIMRKIDQ